MLLVLPAIFVLTLLTGANGAAVGKAWDVSPTSNSDSLDRPSWPRRDSSSSSSAFEVRSISGVGRLPVLENPQDFAVHRRNNVRLEDPNAFPETKDYLREKRELEELEEEPAELIEDPAYEEFLRNRRALEDVEELIADDEPSAHYVLARHVGRIEKPRVRRDADVKMEKISGVKSAREARLNSPETWSKQPISVEFRHRTNLDQSARDNGSPAGMGRQAPKTDFVTSHRRDFAESREFRDMPEARAYDDDFAPMFRGRVRERDFDVPIFRNYYPDRFRMERDYYRRGLESPFYYNRFRDDDVDLYGRALPAPKPKRIIYYATLPEIVRKPIDLRSYPRPYDDVVRSPAVAVASSNSYKRIPGNVDPNRYRYRSPYPYDPYDVVAKRSGYYERPYASYQSRTEEDHRMDQDRDRAALKEHPGNTEAMDDRKMANQVNSRDDGGLPWPVQIGTEVNIKEDERIPGRKIFGQVDNYDRYQNVQLSKATESVGSNDNRNGN